ncbi:MAG: CHASE2 domain-containing protein [Acidobacteriia bacterium]|nr:CHASE2 domain-containing protein [Terriglobia bacterium]
MSGILFVLVCGISTLPVVRTSSVRITDTWFLLAPPPHEPSRAVLVLIDDDSLQQFGRWPWSRVLLAQLNTNLAKAGAGVIGLDILLSEPQSPEADASLRESLQASGRTVLVDEIGTFADGPHWIEPLPEFAEAAGAVGHAHAPLDEDSVCRRFPARELSVNGSRWAFAVELARRTVPERASAFLAAYGIPFSDDNPVVIAAKPILIPIWFRSDRFETISARDVLQGQNLETVRGRPVLVGFGPTEISDRLSTPISRELPAPGVEIHAQILDSILTGRELHEVSILVVAAVLMCTCMLVVIVFQTWHGWWASGLLLMLGIAVYAGGFLTFLWFSRIVPVGPLLLSVVAGPLLVYTADFVMVEQSVTRQLLGLRSWLALQTKSGSMPEGNDLSWKLQVLHDLQTELGSLYELHKTLLESTQDLVAVFDQQGNLLLQNQAFAAAYPSQAETQLTLERLRTRLEPTDDGGLQSRGSVVEGEAYLNDELYSARIAPLPPTALAPGGGTIVTLASLRTRVERDRSRAEALGFITHELRTPLASIQGFAELMMRYPGSSTSAGAPETIFRESKRLLALISSYLDVLRLDAGAKSVSSDLIELDGLVRQVFDILQPLATAAKMRLVFELGEPVALVADAHLLSGAVLNLVSNAIKYGRPGTDIVVRGLHQAGEVIVSVSNIGEPIAPDVMPRLFDAYFRASKVEGSKTGWGLGLAFVKRIAEKHGGSIRAESQPEGNCFEIRLPMKAGVTGATKGVV